VDSESGRKPRKALIGMVMGRTGNKSVKVACYFKVPHPRYSKEVRRKTVVFAHDEGNVCAVGDRVEIVTTRPMSRMKRWRIVTTLQKSEGE
jgi:small subunit ribosomal protein S17